MATDIQCAKCKHVNSVRSDLVQFTCGSCGTENYARNGQWTQEKEREREVGDDGGSYVSFSEPCATVVK